MTETYAKINGTLITYLPPVGTKTIEIEYGIYVGFNSGDSSGVMHHKLKVDGTYVTATNMTHRDDGALNKYVILKSILTVDGSGNVAAGNVDDWNSALAIQLDAREFSSGLEVELHKVTYLDGLTNNNPIIPPTVRITAIA